MAEVLVEDGKLHFHFTTMEHVLGVHRDQSVARADVQELRLVDEPIQFIHGFRVGEGIPGRVAVGSFTGDERILAAVHSHQHKGLFVRLGEGPFDVWVVGLDDPQATVRALSDAGLSFKQ